MSTLQQRTKQTKNNQSKKLHLNETFRLNYPLIWHSIRADYLIIVEIEYFDYFEHEHPNKNGKVYGIPRQEKDTHKIITNFKEKQKHRIKTK